MAEGWVTHGPTRTSTTGPMVSFETFGPVEMVGPRRLAGAEDVPLSAAAAS